MSEIILSKRDLARAHRELRTGFMWRERNGLFHHVQDMHTRHLFFTLRMIWNNVVPASSRVGEVILYDFHPFYTARYMAQAVVNILPELRLRQDMTPEWREQLNWMILHAGEYSEVPKPDNVEAETPPLMLTNEVK